MSRSTLTELEMLGDPSLEDHEAKEEEDKHGGTDVIENHSALVHVRVVLSPSRRA
jgi:hypothetical protein